MFLLVLRCTSTAGSSFENNSYPKSISAPTRHRLTILSTVLSVSRRAESNGNWYEKKIWKMRKMKNWMLLSHHFSGSLHQKTFEGRLIVYQNSFQIQDWCNIQLDNWFLRSLISLASRCARLTESLTTLANSPSIALHKVIFTASAELKW